MAPPDSSNMPSLLNVASSQSPVVIGTSCALQILPVGMALHEKHLALVKERVDEVVKANRCIEKIIEASIKLPQLSSHPRLQAALDKIVEAQEKSEIVLNKAKFEAKFHKHYNTREPLTAQGATELAAILKDTTNDLSAHGMMVTHEMKQVG